MSIDVAQNDATALVTINRPEALNALDVEHLEELCDVLVSIQEDPAICAVVLTGAGKKAFIAGADIKLMSSMSKEMASKFSRRGQQIFSKIEKPVEMT